MQHLPHGVPADARPPFLASGGGRHTEIFLLYFYFVFMVFLAHSPHRLIALEYITMPAKVTHRAHDAERRKNGPTVCYTLTDRATELIVNNSRHHLIYNCVARFYLVQTQSEITPLHPPIGKTKTHVRPQHPPLKRDFIYICEKQKLSPSADVEMAGSISHQT